MGPVIIKGKGVNNNIKIKDLDKGILRVRYSNNRKLSNKLLKDDYKISKRMVNAIKLNKDIHKLSNNEKNIYYELQKFLNKEQDINVLIGSYIAGNNSKSLYNKINKMLYYIYIAEDVCKKHLKAPDMLIQCILVFILYFNCYIIN